MDIFPYETGGGGMKIAKNVKIYPPKMITSKQKFVISPEKYKFPKNGNLRVFSSSIESLTLVVGTRFWKKDPP